MAGVRLATGYIEISAETSKVPKQIQDALNKAGVDAAPPAGKQIGQVLATNIHEGMRTAPTPTGGGGILSDVIAGKTTIGPNVRAQGQKIGRDVGQGINEGVAQSTTAGAGAKIDDAITRGARPRETGRKIGQEISDGISEGAQVSGQDVGATIGESVNASLDKIDISGKLTGKLKTSLEAAIPTIGVLGDVLGVDVAGPLQKASDAIGKIGAKDTATKLGGIADGLNLVAKSAKDLTGVDISGVTGELAGLAGLGATFGPLIDALKGIPVWAGLAESSLLKIAPLAFVGLMPDVKPVSELPGGTPDTKWTQGMNEDQKKRFWDAMARGDRAEAKRIKDEVAGKAPPKPAAGPPSIDIGGGPGGFDWGQGGLPPTPGGFFGTPGPQPPKQPPPGAWGPIQAPPGWSTQPGAFPPSVGIGGGPRGMDWGPWGYAPPTKAAVTGGLPPAAAAAPTTAGAVDIHATSASVSIGSASINVSGIGGVVGGGYTPTTALPAGVHLGGSIGSHQGGGPITDDELSKLHRGEFVANKSQVDAAGGQDAMAGIIAGDTPHPAVSEAQDKQTADMVDAARTGGFVPSGAGSKAVAGTSFVAGLLNLGNEAVAGLIDTGAQAASAAAAMGTFGVGGQAAGPLIQLGAGEAKRATSYGFQMASILADSVIDQIFGPFGGPPRWLGYDYTSFLPNVNIGAIGTTTVEKAMQAAQGKPGAQPGGPVTPEHMGGEQPVGPPVPKYGQPAPPQALGGDMGAPGAPPAGGPGQPPSGGAPPPPPPAPEAPGAAPAPPSGPLAGLDIHNLMGFDDGGWLMPNQPGINTTNRPELVLSPSQVDQMQTTGAGRNPWKQGGGDTFISYVADYESLGREIDKRKRLAAMQYQGRP